MFSLGRQAGNVIAAPYIPFLKENNTRKGFFHHRDYLRLKEALPADLRPVIVLAYYTGMRRGEILSLKWDQIDFLAGTIRLDPGTTKNREARNIPMSSELFAELQAQRAPRDTRFPDITHVFFRHRTGERIRDFRGAWETACKALGFPDAIFDDFRRTGVRNLIRAGVPEKVAMAISGHKTRSVFDRYNIVSEDDIKAASKAVESYLNNLTGTIRLQITEIEPHLRKASGAN